MGIEAPERAQYIRTMYDEITRILNHLMWLGSNALDLGAMAVMLYAFREREELMDCYEAVSGARMHAAYYRPGGVYRDLPDHMPKYKESRWHKAQAAQCFARRLAAGLPGELHRRVPQAHRRIRNPADRQPYLEAAYRRHRRGPELAHQWGMTGVMLRGSGIAWDLRKKRPYAKYDAVDFDIPLGKEGDCYDRYLVRVAEMRESNRIIKQCVAWLKANPGPVMVKNFKVAPPRREDMKDDMEALDPPLRCSAKATAYRPARPTGGGGPEGRVRLLPGLRWRQQAVPRVRAGLRPPVSIDSVVRGHMLADVVAMIGTYDLVFGEVDR